MAVIHQLVNKDAQLAILSSMIDEDEEDLLDFLPLSANKFRIPRFRNYISGVVSELRDSDFKNHFRLKKSTVQVLFERLGPHLRRPNSTSEIKIILSSLWYFANLETLRQIADRFNMSISSVNRSIKLFCKIVLEISINEIHWPSQDEALINIRSFDALREKAFPGVVGAIDGCHIRILPPSLKRKRMMLLDRNSFLNRKQYFSVVLQGICNANLEFISVFAGWPGATNDARVFRVSDIGMKLQSFPSILPENSHIIGDCAYPLLKYLMTPYRDNGHLTDAQRYYNYKLSSSRIIIEQCFGMLYSRFRRLRQLDVYDKSLASSYIFTCVILHNICRKLRDDVDSNGTYQSVGRQETFGGREATAAKQKRDAICNYLFINK